MNIKMLIEQAHETAVSKGWWDDGDRNVFELLALVHSEVSEAVEEARRSNNYVAHGTDESGKPVGFPIELADVLIRIADLCGRYGIDLESALTVKMAYNKTRPYRHGRKLA